jgi:PEP-CTERM motif-containing protein
LDDYGNYTVEFVSPLCENPLECYDTFYINGTNVVSNTPPKLWADPHPIAGDDPCAVDTPGFVGVELICNNGHTLIEGQYNQPDGSVVFGLWSGSSPDPVNDLILNGFFQGGQMTPNGNAFVVETRFDSFWVLVDLDTTPVPEPSTFVLLGTGILGLTGAARRKFSGI